MRLKKFYLFSVNQIFFGVEMSLNSPIGGACGESSITCSVTSECLAAMAHICRGLLSKPGLRGRVTKADTLMLCLRVMTGVIILYDHVDPSGVFRKTSKLDVKSCVRLLKEQNPKSVECLLNAIK
ncbi:unnamed protein product [Dibothriocephalus latus]|uniref:CYRIA/CYRIB Rac1 binding domain-containing protein n=1 Tax=Dibothriocephalus latus TaxID=60516 RepID=A0A3P7LFL4_DIBLA|nr:unnamed protein product [Dibothriocephalus latus]